MATVFSMTFLSIFLSSGSSYLALIQLGDGGEERVVLLPRFLTKSAISVVESVCKHVMGVSTTEDRTVPVAANGVLPKLGGSGAF